MIKYFCDRCRDELEPPKGEVYPLWHLHGREVCKSCKDALDIAIEQARAKWESSCKERGK